MGQGTSGMQTMNQSLYSLYRQGHISHEVALARSNEPAELMAMIDQGSGRGGPGPYR